MYGIKYGQQCSVELALPILSHFLPTLTLPVETNLALLGHLDSPLSKGAELEADKPADGAVRPTPSISGSTARDAPSGTTRETRGVRDQLKGDLPA